MSDIAMLQYSSGSTGTPKGVMVSHKNLLDNLAIIQQIFKSNEASRLLCWLPHTHDMGLIGNILHTIYVGFESWLMAPNLFLRYPFMYLETIGKLDITLTNTPNFALEHCVSRIKDSQVTSLNLVSLNCFVIGAEPIQLNTIKAFYQKFEKAGLSKKVFKPSYGLAEATLAVSFANKLTIDETIQSGKILSIVSCGSPSQEVKIVDSNTCAECPEGAIGEIVVNSGSVTQGYWNNKNLSEAVFKAFKTNNKYYLATGDLGYIKNNELFVTGRIKELLIIAGVNYYASDIENTIKTINPELQKRTSIAISSYNEKSALEQLILFVEIPLKIYNSEAAQTRLKTQILKALLKHHQLSPHEIFFTCKKLPRTTSGKLRRVYCKECYETGRLDKILGGKHDI